MYLEVALEDLGKQQFQIKANTVGAVAEGCALGTVKIDSTNVVQVAGPASVVNSINSVVATVNVDGMANDITDNVVPVFYDENGEVIDTTKLEKSVETVRISAQILNTKDVPWELATMGTPAKGYQLVDVFSNPIVVRVKGVAAVLNTLDKIQIPAAVLDLTGVTSTIEKTIDISTYLEEGVSLVVSADAKVSVTAEIEPIETKEYKVSVSNLTAEGLKSGYQLSYAERYATVKITAGKGVHNDLNAAELKGTIKVDELEEGIHLVQVDLNIDTTIYTVETALVEVEIKAVANGNGNGTGNSGGDNNVSTENSEKPEESTQTGGTGSTEKPETDNTENAGTENVGVEEGKTSENTDDGRN